MASSLLLLAAALPALSLAQHVNARSSGIVNAGNLIHYPLVATTGSSVFGNSRRQNSVSALGQRTGTIYTINISLGTPGQSVPVQFDTGASELWVNPVCAKASDQAFCLAQPRFTQSATLVDLGVQGYNDIVRGPGGDGTGYVNFEYVFDYVTIGSARIAQQIFGVAYDSVRPSVGILGVGPEQSPSGWDSAYPHILDSLATQGFINSRAFSMDLQGLGSTSGSVIFGGIDTKKYQGSLLKLPIVPAAQAPDGNTRYYIRLDGISVNQPDGTIVSVYQKAAGGLGQVVQIHSGYTLSSFSTVVFQKLVAAFPSAQAVQGDELYSVDCLDAGQGGSLDFTFGDKVINVPYSDFVWRDPRSGLCILGAFADDYISVLGDTFLRAAYVVFDWDNRNIHLAQSADCGTNLVAIGAGADAVPSVVGDCAVTEPTSTSSSTTASSTPTTETSTTTSEVSTTSEASTTSEESTTSTESNTSSTTEGSTTASSTTDTTSSSTTDTSSAGPIEQSTLTYTHTTIYTITSCAPEKTACRTGQVVTEVITSLTTICPQTTATYTIGKVPVTITPAVTGDTLIPPAAALSAAPAATTASGASSGKPAEVATPAVSSGSAPTVSQAVTVTRIPAPSSYWSTALSGGNGTAVSTSKPTSPPVVVAGAGRTNVVSAVAGLVVVAGVMAFGL
ncbi:aspartic peptidase domain-containing protein [Coniochaeta sp. 2T2.1]|nr:aspartic peptidase domain-containing protein [Coniochaeta sp. 2T2.1]